MCELSITLKNQNCLKLGVKIPYQIPKTDNRALIVVVGPLLDTRKVNS